MMIASVLNASVKSEIIASLRIKWISIHVLCLLYLVLFDIFATGLSSQVLIRVMR